MPDAPEPADVFAATFTTAMRAGVSLERATLHPWVVSAQYLKPPSLDSRPGNSDLRSLILIVESPLSLRPDAYDHIQAGADVLREDTFPAEHFATMALEVRPRYRAEYEVFVKWRRAKEAFKDPADAVAIDYAAGLWLHPGSNPLGD